MLYCVCQLDENVSERCWILNKVAENCTHTDRKRELLNNLRMEKW